MKHFTILCASLLLCACTTATPIGEWRDPAFAAKLDKILIIGVSENRQRRLAFENSFVAALQDGGVEALPSHELIESSADLTRDRVEKAIEGRDLGAVLVTRLAGVEQGEIYRPPTINRHYRSFDGYYDHVLQQNNAGYYSQFQLLTLETHVYDVASRQLVWSLQSEIIDSTKPREMIAQQIALTIEALRKQGLLGP